MCCCCRRVCCRPCCCRVVRPCVRPRWQCPNHCGHTDNCVHPDTHCQSGDHCDHDGHDATCMPTDGCYVIVCRDLSPTGQQLAITFNGENCPASVTPVNGSSEQKWIIQKYNDHTQSLSPVNAPHLQASWGSGFVNVQPAGGYVWTIRTTDSGVTIQDGGVTVFWGVQNADPNDHVTIGNGTGGPNQRWILEKA